MYLFWDIHLKVLGNWSWLWSCEWDETAVKPWRECEREREECVRERERERRECVREREMRRDCEGERGLKHGGLKHGVRERELGETVELDSDHLEAQELAGNLQWHMGDLSANQADERVCQALGQWPRPRKPPRPSTPWNGNCIRVQFPAPNTSVATSSSATSCCYVDQQRLLSCAAPNQWRLRTFGTVKPQLQVHIGTSHRALFP